MIGTPNLAGKAVTRLTMTIVAWRYRGKEVSCRRKPFFRLAGLFLRVGRISNPTQCGRLRPCRQVPQRFLFLILYLVQVCFVVVMIGCFTVSSVCVCRGKWERNFWVGMTDFPVCANNSLTCVWRQVLENDACMHGVLVWGSANLGLVVVGVAAGSHLDDLSTVVSIYYYMLFWKVSQRKWI